MSQLLLTILWSDPDLIEIGVKVTFDGWAGHERAYATRSELMHFAAQVDAVASGATAAVLDAGQPDLSWIRLRVYEYTRSRQLGLGIEMGRASRSISNWPHGDTRLEFAVPIERGPLAAFAQGLRHMIAAEGGEVTLPVLPAWP